MVDFIAQSRTRNVHPLISKVLEIRWSLNDQVCVCVSPESDKHKLIEYSIQCRLAYKTTWYWFYKRIGLISEAWAICHLVARTGFISELVL